MTPGWPPRRPGCRPYRRECARRAGRRLITLCGSLRREERYQSFASCSHTGAFGASQLESGWRPEDLLASVRHEHPCRHLSSFRREEPNSSRLCLLSDYASSGMPTSSVGTGSSADTESSAAPGLGWPTEGIEARRPVPGSLAVQRSVHDLASLQYQRMSAQACPPSGTIRSSGSAMPHSEQRVDCDGRGWSLRCRAIGAPRAREMLVHQNSATSSGAPAGRTAVADGAYAAIVPPREQDHQGLRRCADSLL
jgi:hypothetical protein